jgi:alkylhydroperoxidase/carboxymuconolactone decarboxylase family protein YurZ
MFKIKGDVMKNTASSIMEKLYGKERSDKVYDRLESLNPTFNRAVQDIAYDYFWVLPGLSLRDKSFVTLISLIVLHKEEQTKIHYYGFLNSGGSKEELAALLKHLRQVVNIDIAKKSLQEVLSERDESFPEVFSSLAQKDQEIAGLASAAALSDGDRTRHAMKHLLEKYPDAAERIEQILMHQIVYCGFPVAMNGFAILQELV